MAAPRLILASASPRRASLLREAGLEFEIREADIDESWKVGEHPVAYTRRIAQQKLEAVERKAGEIRLAADTSVWLSPELEPYGKPRSRDEARDMILALSRAEKHQVTTAFALDGLDGTDVEAVTTIVLMRGVYPDELELYLDGEDWGDKAGAYGIQARAAAFVPSVEGSYTNVVGLPVYEVLQALAKLGISPKVEPRT